MSFSSFEPISSAVLALKVILSEVGTHKTVGSILKYNELSYCSMSIIRVNILATS